MLALPLIALALSLGAAILCPRHHDLYADPGRPDVAEPRRAPPGG